MVVAHSFEELVFFFFQAEDGIRDLTVTGVQTCALPIWLQLFFSRAVKGKAGEDLVEKQNAEIGLMPVVAGEPAVYGYEAEDRHFVRAFLKGEPPELTFDDGVEVVKLLMTAYMSAEQGKTLEFPQKGLEHLWRPWPKGRWGPYVGRRTPDAEHGAGQPHRPLAFP